MNLFEVRGSRPVESHSHKSSEVNSSYCSLLCRLPSQARPQSSRIVTSRWRLTPPIVPCFVDFLQRKRLSIVFTLSPVIRYKREEHLEQFPKGQFSKIRYISKEVCRILHLWTQMQCLSGKTDRLSETKNKAPLCKGSCQRS